MQGGGKGWRLTATAALCLALASHVQQAKPPPLATPLPLPRDDATIAAITALDTSPAGVE